MGLKLELVADYVNNLAHPDYLFCVTYCRSGALTNLAKKNPRCAVIFHLSKAKFVQQLL